MNSRLTLEEKIKSVELYIKFGNSEQVRREWKNHLASEPPSRPTILSLVEKFQETGSVEDKSRSGRPRTAVSEESIKKVSEKLLECPKISIRVASLELGMSKDSFHRAAQEAGFRPYRPYTVIELSEDDFDRRDEFSSTFLALLEQNPGLLDKIIWSDESEFRLNGVVNRHNSCYWAQANPQEQMPVQHTSAGVMVWCAVTSTKIIGPYFFDGSVNADSYLMMLKEFLWPQVKYKRMYFQQDGAPAHYASSVRSWLNEKFPNRWIGRRGPIEWPARSPDLSPCDFFLWGYLKDKVYQEKSATIAQLRQRIYTACAEISAEMCSHVCQSMASRLERCRELVGKQLHD